jgi:hypothetical protein
LEKEENKQLPQKEELSNRLKFLQTEQILELTSNYLKAEENYIKIRLEIAEKLQNYCNGISLNNIEHASKKALVKIISELLGTVSIPVAKVVNINPSKPVEAFSNLEDYRRIISEAKISEEFKNCLENRENDKSLFKKSYEDLVEAIKKGVKKDKKSETSNKVVDALLL